MCCSQQSHLSALQSIRHLHGLASKAQLIYKIGYAKQTLTRFYMKHILKAETHEKIRIKIITVITTLGIMITLCVSSEKQMKPLPKAGIS